MGNTPAKLRGSSRQPAARSVLIRIVRMTFRPEAVPDFLVMFESTAPHIRAFPGCMHLELWADHQYENILTTYSHWADSDSLAAYRHSDLFQSTWARTREWFAAPPGAHSYLVRRTVGGSQR